MADNGVEVGGSSVLIASVSFDDANNGPEKAQESENSFVDIVLEEDAPDAAGHVTSDTVASFDILQSVSALAR